MYIHLISLILFLLQPVSAAGTLSIQLVDYNNPSSKDNAGSCCDCCGAFGWCPNDCENFFKLIVAPYPLSFFSFLDHLSWKHWETFILGDDSFSFPGYGHTVGANNLKNPLTYHFNGRWPVRCFSDFFSKPKKNEKGQIGIICRLVIRPANCVLRI